MRAVQSTFCVGMHGTKSIWMTSRAKACRIRQPRRSWKPSKLLMQFLPVWWFGRLSPNSNLLIDNQWPKTSRGVFSQPRRRLFGQPLALITYIILCLTSLVSQCLLVRRGTQHVRCASVKLSQRHRKSVQYFSARTVTCALVMQRAAQLPESWTCKPHSCPQELRQYAWYSLEKVRYSSLEPDDARVTVHQQSSKSNQNLNLEI